MKFKLLIGLLALAMLTLALTGWAVGGIRRVRTS